MAAAPATACAVCRRGFDPGDHPARYESSFLLLRVCPDCVEGYVGRHGTRCVNCGGVILPHSQVAVYPGDSGRDLYGHATVACNPAGNTFSGYWGRGELTSAFRCIEAC